MLKSRINEWKAIRGITSEEIAAVLNVTRESVSNWANNKSNPSLLKSFQLAKLFNCKVDDLWYYIEK